MAVAKFDGSTLTVAISPAYVHRSKGFPGIGSGTCWLQDVVMVLIDCALPIAFPKLPLALWAGRAVTGKQTYEGTVPLPFLYTGPVCVDLSFEDGTFLQISAMEIRIDTVGEPTYLEDFPV